MQVNHRSCEEGGLGEPGAAGGAGRDVDKARGDITMPVLVLLLQHGISSVRLAHCEKRFSVFGCLPADIPWRQIEREAPADLSGHWLASGILL